MQAKGGYVYILSNKLRTTLYIGVTSDLSARVNKHQTDSDAIFVKKYQCFYPIYYEFHETIDGAIEREKQLKKWKRQWKEDLVRSVNLTLMDLTAQIQELT